MTDFISTFISTFISVNARDIKFNRVLENVQAHVLLRVTTSLAFIPLTPLYGTAQQYRIFILDNSAPNIFLVILIYDFTYFWFHRLSHYAAPLWAIHIVHHHPEQLEASVALRDSFLSPVVTWVLAVPLIYAGFAAESVITAFLIHSMYQVPCHNHWFPRMKWLEYVLITPSLHHVHHGKNKPYVDTNFGNIFSVWDRLFRSLQVENENKEIIGVKANTPHNIFLCNLQLILKRSISKHKLSVQKNTVLLKVIDTFNLLFLLIMYYCFYLQPVYLFILKIAVNAKKMCKALVCIETYKMAWPPGW